MKKAIVIYQSKTGTTRQLAYEIKEHLKKQKLMADLVPASMVHKQDLSNYDYVFLGCWTKGLMVMAQHPAREWINSIRSLNIHSGSRIVLFTTYKLLTGRMFRQMQKHLPGDSRQQTELSIKSRDGHLNDTETNKLQDFIHINS